MGNYSFDSSAAYVFKDKTLFEVDDVLAVSRQSSDNPLPVWRDCFIMTFYDGDPAIHAHLMDSVGITYAVPLYRLHQLLMNGDIVIKQAETSQERLSVARERGIQTSV